MSLSSPSVNANEIESSTLKLWHEWLGLWFNGASHAIGGSAAVAFPALTLRFGQSEAPQPVDGVMLTVVMLSPSVVTRKWEVVGGTRQEMGQAPVQFQCWIRAAGKMSDGADPQWHAARAADLLFAILANSSSHHDLVQKGIMRLQPRPHESLVERNYATRLLAVRAVLRFPILSQT